MKKLLLILIAFFAFILQFCTSLNKASSRKGKMTYVANIRSIIVNSCSPCHIPPEGNKKLFNTYTAVRTNIDSILIRIQKKPGEKGFMPARHPKLSDSTINIFKRWKNDGLLEK